uniref:hypothetical protein n=1 Tax=Xanthobacter autotrophicus TaxID=280 RepID=UPI00372D2801
MASNFAAENRGRRSQMYCPICHCCSNGMLRSSTTKGVTRFMVRSVWSGQKTVRSATRPKSPPMAVGRWGSMAARTGARCSSHQSCTSDRR